ncbi:DarT1-associated NADAR antitoxin family protein [Psychrobacter sp. bablab_jr014]|uniref:DarT1-associated NADAR antitoxin family protein n=1 Tax=unclassified Psychrobacter TaxID=196806 RepID=UPI003A4C6E5B
MEQKKHPMAHRQNGVEHKPVFMPRVNSDNLVKTDMVRFERHVGFATRQKKKSINDMHQVIRKKYGFKHVLELSSKSGEKLSFLLNPSSLQLASDDGNQTYSVENAFYASKVFKHGGPYTDLLTSAPRQAKKDERLSQSGALFGYDYFGMEWSVEPLTAFYDWLYITALKQNEALHEQVMQYQAFTDLTFNPKKSIHSAAYALAMFVAPSKRELLDTVEDPGEFYDLYYDFKISNTAHLLEDGWV